MDEKTADWTVKMMVVRTADSMVDPLEHSKVDRSAYPTVG